MKWMTIRAVGARWIGLRRRVGGWDLDARPEGAVQDVCFGRTLAKAPSALVAWGAELAEMVVCARCVRERGIGV